MKSLTSVIYSIPDFWLILLFTALVPLYAFVLFRVLCWVFRKREFAHDSYYGMNMFNSTAAMTGILLIFTLVQAIGTVQKIKVAINDEVVAIERVDILLANYGAQEAELARNQLRQYVHSIVNDEWDEMLNPAADQVRMSKELLTLSDVLVKLPATTMQEKDLYSKSNAAMSDLLKTRYARMQFAGGSLPTIFFFGIFVLLNISIIFFFHLSKKNAFASYTLLFQMGAVGVLTGLVVIYDNPFYGESRVTPHSYETCLPSLPLDINSSFMAK